jgi:hypothetical protein
MKQSKCYVEKVMLRYFVDQTFVDPNIRQPKHSSTRTFVKPNIRQPEHLLTQTFVDLNICRPEHSSTRTFVDPNIHWPCEYGEHSPKFNFYAKWKAVLYIRTMHICKAGKISTFWRFLSTFRQSAMRQSGWPVWANFRLMSDCLLRAAI